MVISNGRVRSSSKPRGNGGRKAGSTTSRATERRGESPSARSKPKAASGTRRPARARPTKPVAERATERPTRGKAAKERGSEATAGDQVEKGGSQSAWGFLVRQRNDVWGLVLLAAGVFAGIGIYADAGGPAGRIIRHLTAAAIGWGRFMLPLVLAGLAILLIAQRSSGREPARLASGLALIFASVSGLADLAAGGPSLHERIRALYNSGGYLGAVTGSSVSHVLGSVGAGTVLVTAMAIGLVFLTRCSVKDALAKAYSFARGFRKVAQDGSGTGVPVGGLASPDVEGLDDGAGAQRNIGAGMETGGLRRDDGDDAEFHHSPDPQATQSVLESGEGGGTASLSEAGAQGQEAVHAQAGARRDSRYDLAGGVKRASANAGSGGAEPGPWRLPPISLLSRSRRQRIDRQLVEQGGRTLVEALGAHGVETRLVHTTVGPTVTRYEIELGLGVKVARVTSLSKDIAYAMASPDVRILAPVPGKSAIGVEVANRARQLVSLGDVLSSDEARAATHPLEVALGRDIAGRPVMVNLADMPHLLISGATGAGKSSCINSMITTILMRTTPEEVRMILVDPKRVELGHYRGLPHLLTQVVVNPKKAANALQWAVAEMERRYDLLAEVGVRDITGFNAAVAEGVFAGAPADFPTVSEPGASNGAASAPSSHASLDEKAEQDRYRRLPFILVIVDELNDLMMVAARDVEESVCRIAQMARAVGIHLVLATQRPSVDVITGVIKANIPSRLAFSVSSLADSRVILDQPGAERIIGKGDLLLVTASSSVPHRLQAPWVSEAEVRTVTAYWRRQGQPSYDAAVEGEDSAPGSASVAGDGGDELLERAMELVVRSQLGSTSMLQRKLRVGFARAGRLMDLLEQRGVVGPSEGSKARSVLMTPEELDELA